ncbi:MAG: MurR/RpiR family transcriptional regulator, partial [Bullifex sp.]|nr:MurR/RpiR family transcriptional regulator [Bullifex sp.]
KSERALADHIVRDADSVVMKTITELAGESDSFSTASITRFCKKIGLSGYSELRLELAKEMATDNARRQIVADGENLVPGLVSTVVDASASAINDLKYVLSDDVIKKAVHEILSASSITLAGIGASALVAQDLRQKLLRLGIRSLFDADQDVVKVTLSSGRSKDLLIAISYSGTTRETLDAVNIAKENGMRVLAMTKKGDNPISEQADVTVPVSENEALLREGATLSRLQMLVTVDMIYRALIMDGGVRYDLILDSWDAVNRRIK